MERAALSFPQSARLRENASLRHPWLTSVYVGPTYEATGHPLAQGVVQGLLGGGKGRGFHQHHI